MNGALSGSLQKCVGFKSIDFSHRGELYLEKEVFRIPITISLSPNRLNHVIHTFYLTGGDRKLCMVDYSHQMPLYRIAKREELRQITLPRKPHPSFHSLVQLCICKAELLKQQVADREAFVCSKEPL